MDEHKGPWARPPSPPPPERRAGLGFYLWLGLLAAAGAGVWAMAKAFPGQLNEMDWTDALRDFGLLALVSSSLVYARGIKWGQAVRHIALWVAVVSALAVTYAFRGELLEAGRRVRAELIPAYAVKTGAHEMVLTQGEGGGFYVMGKVNGAPVRFVIDTGASDIVLSPDDARRAGADMAALDFRHSYETANGAGTGAPFIAKRFEVGGVTATDVAVSVNGAPMSSSLLGMAFMRRLDSYEVRGARMTLRWHG